jgi:beta-lactamase superfamily II metal-dependent hydrolase
MSWMRLRAKGAQVLRTDDVGTIVVTIDGSPSLRVAAEDVRWTLLRSRVRQSHRGSG